MAYKARICLIFKEGGCWVQGLKIREHDFEITSDPKGLQGGPTVWSGFEAPDPPKRAPKIEIGN